MNILVVSFGCPSEKYPNNGIFQFDQAKALAEYGHNVVFAAVDVRSVRKWRKWGISTHSKGGIPVYEFNAPIGPILPKLRGKIAVAGFEKLLKRIIRERGVPDVVHAHFADTAGCVVRACRKASIPYIVTEHSSGVNRDEISAEHAAKLRMIYGGAAQVVAVSKPLADRILKHTGIRAEVIPNIVDTALFTMRTDARTSYGFTYLSAGNVIKSKGYDILIAAFKKVCDVQPNSALVIMGGGPERGALERQVSDLGLQDKVRFTGMYERSEFFAQLRDCNAFVLASRSETFGVVYIEAMACGVPVIATMCGGPEDFVTAENGILVPIDDSDALARSMLEMRENIGRYDSNAIAQFAKKTYSPRNVAERLTNTFERAISEYNETIGTK